jgi:hypothetical protein
MRDDSLVVTYGHRNDDVVFVDGGERMVLHVVLEAEHLPGVTRLHLGIPSPALN